MGSLVKCHPEAFSLSLLLSLSPYLIKLVLQDWRMVKNQRDSIALLSPGSGLKPLNSVSSAVSESPRNKGFDSMIFIP